MKSQGQAKKLPTRANRDPNSLDKAGLSPRSERAKYLRTIRQSHRDLMAAIKRDRFLNDWLEVVQQDRLEYERARESITDSELSAMAIRSGFRTSKSWLNALKDYYDLHHHFVHAEAFKQLWEILKKHQSSNNIEYCYSPTPTGVPRKFIEAVLTWHKAPKFTHAERRAHSRKIAKSCQDLEDLLGQVEPSHSLDGQFSRFRFSDKAQAGALYRAFGLPHKEDDQNPFFGTQWNASHRLQFGGVVPLWAVQNIKIMATDGAPRSNPLPAKIRAKAAKKTYFIGVVAATLKVAAYQTNVDFQIKPQLIADLVGLLSNLDCTADDVRKASQ